MDGRAQEVLQLSAERFWATHLYRLDRTLPRLPSSRPGDMAVCEDAQLGRTEVGPDRCALPDEHAVAMRGRRKIDGLDHRGHRAPFESRERAVVHPTAQLIA